MNKNKTKLTELTKNDKSNPEFSALATFFFKSMAFLNGWSYRDGLATDG